MAGIGFWFGSGQLSVFLFVIQCRGQDVFVAGGGSGRVEVQ